MAISNRNIMLNDIIVHAFGGKVNTGQLDGVHAILDGWEASKLKDRRWLAYILATTYHETDKTMRSIEEYGKGRGKLYGSKVKYNKTMYEKPNKLYYGRGLVQLTWYENYDKMGKLLDLPLLEQPELMLELDVSVKALIIGMTTGMFTGVKLSTYFNNKRDDPINARRIINGLDRAELIAGYYVKFLKAVI